MKFSEKLAELRRSKGWSQEQLGEKLGVTRQTISKWELGTTTPDMDKLAAMSDLFGITTDELIKGTDGKPASAGSIPLNERKRPLHFEYKSQRSFRGVPLVHVNFGLGNCAARGIVAIGNRAVGVVSVGFLSAGVVSLGLLSVGLFALGVLAAGLFAFGSFAAGFMAFGAISAGWLAFGGVAGGYYAVGGAAAASQIAFGGLADAHIAIGDEARGMLEITSRLPAGQARELILQELPGTPGFIADMFARLAELMSA